MPKKARLEFSVLEPRLQISFFYKLEALRGVYLDQGLSDAVRSLDIADVDADLRRFVERKALGKLASFGLRGEVVFAVPTVLRASPKLLGYYGLLYGLSQKEFYNKGPFGRFKRLEEKGEIPEGLEALLPGLCRSLAKSGEALIEGIDRLSLGIVDDLQLLTIGPQLRGSENTRLGQDATRQVFDLIHAIVRPSVKKVHARSISLVNDSKREVRIEFASDPDICITEQLKSASRPLVSVEIKGGADISNVHNRLGEAEKSHQKAKNRGYFEFWTILRVDVEQAIMRRESPTTTHFFHLDKIDVPASREHQEFREILGSVLGIRVR